MLDHQCGGVGQGGMLRYPPRLHHAPHGTRGSAARGNAGTTKSAFQKVVKLTLLLARSGELGHFVWRHSGAMTDHPFAQFPRNAAIVAFYETEIPASCRKRSQQDVDCAPFRFHDRTMSRIFTHGTPLRVNVIPTVEVSACSEPTGTSRGSDSPCLCGVSLPSPHDAVVGIDDLPHRPESTFYKHARGGAFI